MTKNIIHRNIIRTADDGYYFLNLGTKVNSADIIFFLENNNSLYSYYLSFMLKQSSLYPLKPTMLF